MSDWTYEPLILKLKAALAEVDAEVERKTAPDRVSSPRAARNGSSPYRDPEPYSFRNE